MKKDIRKYIDENRDIFDDKEPLAGHAERFEALLKKQNETGKEEKPAKRIKMITFLSVAASIAILIGIGVKFYAPDSIHPMPSTEETQEMNEFQATNDYYNQQMEELIADIMCKLANTEPENQERLTKDLQKIIDQNNAFISEMERNENQEIAIHYLVKHYKANIDALDNINEKLGKYSQC